MKICSFLPSGTEIVCALGLADSLVGVSHECDYPPEVKGKPVVVESAVDTRRMTSAEIDRCVAESLKKGESLYRVDKERLKQLDPDVIITQALCEVCAPSGNEAKQALAVVSEKTKVLYLTPHSLEDIFENIRSVGEATGTLEKAKKLIYNLRLRATNVQCETFSIRNKPRAFVLEWLDPPYNAGHWVPELVSVAGGVPDLSSEGKDSTRTSWEKIAEFNPDILICSPCGYHLDRVLREIPLLKKCPCPEYINAFKTGQIYAVDADAYFARPGPRVIDGIELLSHIFHPHRCSWYGPSEAFRRVSLSEEILGEVS